MSAAIPALLLAFLCGGVVGAVYLALVWRAVRHLADRRFWLVFACAGVLRIGLLGAALAVGITWGAQASHIAAALLGFVTVRTGATRMAGPITSGGVKWR